MQTSKKNMKENLTHFPKRYVNRPYICGVFACACGGCVVCECSVYLFMCVYYFICGRFCGLQKRIYERYFDALPERYVNWSFFVWCDFVRACGALYVSAVYLFICVCY